MKEYKLAIIGATGVIGRITRKVLEERKLPIKEYKFFSSSKSAGSKIKFLDKEYIVQELKEDSFDENFDFAIFVAGGEVAKKYIPIANKKNCIVIDNSSAFRMEEDVPLVIPEVNSEEITNHQGIIANPNCSTIQAVVALKPLDDKYKIKRIVYSTYQAVSGAGVKGIRDLEKGIEKYNNQYKSQDTIEIADENIDKNATQNIENEDKLEKEYKLEKFKYPIFNNCIPQIDVFVENGYTKEEEKMINETRKILKKPDLKITATTVRVPVFNCHSEMINVEFENEFGNEFGNKDENNIAVEAENEDIDNGIEEIKNLLKNSPGIKVIDEKEKEEYPLQENANNTDFVYVGRIRRDYSVKSGINMWVVADNTRKGAATNAVQILEKLLMLPLETGTNENLNCR